MTERRRRRRGARIEVRRLGERVELVLDGISYSTFHPERPWSGYVWDALAAAVLLLRTRRPRVLLLGGGAGTALVLLRRLRPEAKLLAVELDAEIIAVARMVFRLDAAGAEIVHADGLEYLARTRRRFDLVLDDMFAPGPDGLRRPVADETSHLRLVASRLRPGGVAATNATTDDDPPGYLDALRDAYRSTFPHRVTLFPPRGFNAVLAGSRAKLATRELRQAASALPPLDQHAVDAVRVRRW